MTRKLSFYYFISFLFLFGVSTSTGYADGTEESAQTPISIYLSRPITNGNLPRVHQNEKKVTTSVIPREKNTVLSFPKTSDQENAYFMILGILLLLFIISLYLYTQERSRK
jgi:LPXTG-motif cell wall-anchored protein